VRNAKVGEHLVHLNVTAELDWFI